MITQTNIAKRKTPNVLNKSACITNDSSKISEINRDDINISIWQRNLNNHTSEASEYVLTKNPLLEFSEVLQPENVIESLKTSIGSNEEMLPFFDDVFNLVSMFCKTFDQKKAWLRLDGIDHPMCPRFHTDKLKCRLVTTYIGPATQWLPHDLVNRSKLGHGNQGKPDDKSGLFIGINDIEQLDKGHVALLKGESWKGNQGRGLVHRSPHEEGNYKRLYMTIDFLDTYLNIFRN